MTFMELVYVTMGRNRSIVQFVVNLNQLLAPPPALKRLAVKNIPRTKRNNRATEPFQVPTRFTSILPQWSSGGLRATPLAEFFRLAITC